MKVTQYFLHTRERPDRAKIQDNWLKQAMSDRRWEKIQQDGKIKRWTWIEEEGKFLKVILLEGGKTLHNAFFDRRFNPETLT